jgi:pyruvate,water dikinase
LEWEPPGDGLWFLTREHFPAPVSRLFATLFPPTTRGWFTSAQAYGIPSGVARWGTSNSWLYFAPGSGADPSTYDALEAAAVETLASARWRDDVARWHDVDRPRIVAANLALQHENLATLDDLALAEHVRRAVAHFLAVGIVHFELHTAFNVAGGLLFEACTEWGLTPPQLAPLFAGSSPASAAARVHIDRIAAAMPAPPATIDDVRAGAPIELDAYLEEYGWRCLDQHEMRGATLGERPDIIVASVRARMAGIGTTDATRSTPAMAPDAVPEAERDRFDALLADARATYMLNDDNVGITWGWPLGLVRRAALDAGRRLVAGGRLHHVDHVFHADLEELVALLAGSGPSADALATRAVALDDAAAADPPGSLGTPGPASPTDVALPPTVRRLEKIRSALWSWQPPTTDTLLTGLGIGDGVYRGRACVIDGDGLLDIEPGDVIIATVTHAGHNTIFPIAGAVATAEGGLLSHPAVLARELGLPAVVGVRGLLDHVKTGDLVEIDAAAGVIRVADR